MTAQLALDFTAPRARTVDPDTSRAAAASMTGEALTRQATTVLDALTRIHDRTGRGATAWEITAALEHTVQQNVVARRLTDIRSAGLAVDTGERRPGRSGRPLAVHVPTNCEATS